MLGWTDIHTHLNMLEEGPENGLQQALQNGVDRVITIGTHPDDLDVVYNLAKQYHPKVFCTLGIHPHDANLYTDEVEKKIISRLSSPEVVAVGEIGLDYYYKNSAIDIQKKVFKRQLEIAQEHKLPIEIHTRDAEEDTIEILKSVGPTWTGVLHCFTGTQFLADKALKLGLDISVSGVVTFKSADSLREVIKSVPLDRLHVETDAPFLAPVPMRGKKNQPAFVIHTATFLANLKGVELEVLKQQVHRNNLRTFPKLASVAIS
ncbi:MAG: TatD family hydrolase [Bdellovibrionales bacterium]|nr:TatD family hydrolase [Bdellovibrionales bacterium]